MNIAKTFEHDGSYFYEILEKLEDAMWNTLKNDSIKKGMEMPALSVQ